MDIRTQSVNFTADQKLLDYIEKKLNKLEQLHNRITDVAVFLKLENTGQVRDKIVEVKVSIPNQVLIAKEKSKSFEESTDLVVDVLKRQVRKYKEKMQSHR